MAFTSPVLKHREFDSNGDPLSGGKLYTFEAGTSTPKDTYVDSLGSALNTNPIILDANGEYDLYIKVAEFYKFVLYDENDVLQWSEDNISTPFNPDAPVTVVTNDMLADMAPNTIKGRAAGTGSPVNLTSFQAKAVLSSIATDSTTTGIEQSLVQIDTTVLRLTDPALESINMIFAGYTGQEVTLINKTGAVVTLLNNVGATTSKRIITGTGTDLEMADSSSVKLCYDDVTQRWIVVGGSGSGGGSGAVIGDPTVGGYTGPLKLTPTTTIADAHQKEDNLLSKLVPAGPDDLSDKTVNATGQYTAKRATTGTNDICTDDTTPTVNVATYAQSLANSFVEADEGTLSVETDSVETGTVDLDSGDNSGTYGEMTIQEFDPYAGQGFGKEGIWKGLIARMTSATLSVGNHIVAFIHTVTGTASLDFWIDDPTTSVISSKVLTSSGTSSYKSGVPGIAQGQNINVAFDVDDFCGTHYNASKIAGAQSPQTGSQVNATLGGPYVSSDTFNASINLPVAASAYSEDVVATCKAYNSKDTLVSSTVTNGIRVDTVGTETRVKSGTTQYPASGYGAAYDATESLAINKELQFLNGKFQRPPAVNYSTKIPVGPDYTSLTDDAYGTMRWATFNVGSISAATSKTFTLSSVTGISSVLQSGMDIYLKVEGATGWLNANGAYPGVGNPSADGDLALDVGGSTATVRRVTFGATPRTGTVYVRIGLPTGSTKSFGGVS